MKEYQGAPKDIFLKYTIVPKSITRDQKILLWTMTKVSSPVKIIEAVIYMNESRDIYIKIQNNLNFCKVWFVMLPPPPKKKSSGCVFVPPRPNEDQPAITTPIHQIPTGSLIRKIQSIQQLVKLDCIQAEQRIIFYWYLHSFHPENQALSKTYLQGGSREILSRYQGK